MHAATVGGDVVFLSLADDRYFCLPSGGRRLVLSDLRASIATEEAALLEDLRRMALLQATGTRAASPQPDPPLLPVKDLDDGPEVGFGVSDVPMALRCLRDALLRYRGRSLAHLIVQARRTPRPIGLTPALIAEVRRYRRVARWLPIPRKCLLQSFLLLLHLRRCGHDAAWVFATRTWPFEAHCWLQVEDLVLDDRHERLVAFTPLLVV
ncbi:MAG: lasso peptide biosynthesis B2 protein [Alphaproteobacteria bacterium]|nr:lasso peptide biosynthesis B2 protein [Alphaproteobacteria bacterium]MBU2307462.1 lasso peptide biosynthesis B2 protein [Alphaproteobacteria bacterium]